MEYDYYEGDNAVYRAPKGALAVTEVKSKDEWLPYTGDGFKIRYWGSKITEEEANAF